jgi:hypothetical protein
MGGTNIGKKHPLPPDSDDEKSDDELIVDEVYMYALLFHRVTLYN